MALFDKLRKVLTWVKRQAAEEAVVNEANYDSPFSGRKNMPIESEKQDLIAQLTPREYDVYLQLLEGYTLKESARRLSIKYSTANTHMSVIFRKLQVKSRAELIINYHNITIPN